MRREISSRYRPGDKLPSMRELRQRFDVSINIIGAALDLLARDEFVERRQGRGVYVGARAAHARVGILSELDLFDQRIGRHFQALAGAAKSRLQELGAEPQLYVGNAQPGLAASDEPTCPHFWSDAAGGRLDGAVILDVPSTDAWARRVRGCPVPAVGSMTGFTADEDHDGIVNAAVRQLVASGCRRLGLLSWDTVEPFHRAVSAAGVVTCDAWIRADLDPAVRGAGWEEFREIWSTKGEKPDGLVILDDILFADAQMAIFEIGVRVPEDLQLAVQTNRDVSPPARLPVTAIEVDPVEAGTVLADLLMQRRRGAAPVPLRHILSYREVPAAAKPAAAGPPVPGGGVSDSLNRYTTGG